MIYYRVMTGVGQGIAKSDPWKALRGLNPDGFSSSRPAGVVQAVAAKKRTVERVSKKASYVKIKL